MIEKQYIPADWSKFTQNSSETVMDTNNFYFTQELPEDNRKLDSDGEAV